MKKIPTIFKRDEQRRFVIPEINEEARWVFEETTMATRKYDGTCMFLDEDENWYYRREVKSGPVPDSMNVVNIDNNTGHVFGWMPLDDFSHYKYFLEAYNDWPLDYYFVNYGENKFSPGTYELIGPKVNGNPEKLSKHRLMPHAKAAQLGDIQMLEIYNLSVEDAFNALFRVLSYQNCEGTVFYGLTNNSKDGRMAKLKVKDFPR